MPHISLLLSPQSSSLTSLCPENVCQPVLLIWEQHCVFVHIGLIKTYESIAVPLSVSFLICTMGLIKNAHSQHPYKVFPGTKSFKIYCYKSLLEGSRRAHSNLVALLEPSVLARNAISHWQTTHQKTRDSQTSKMLKPPLL